MELGSHWTDFHEIWYVSIFRNFFEKNQVALRSDKNNGYFTWRPINIFDHISIDHLFSEWEMFQTKFVTEIKTHILCSITFFAKSYRLWDLKIYFKVRQTTDDMAHAHLTLDTKGYTHTLGICDRYISCTATMVAWSRLSVTLTYTDCVVFHSWFFRGKTARTFVNITSSSPNLQTTRHATDAFLFVLFAILPSHHHQHHHFSRCIVT